MIKIDLADLIQIIPDIIGLFLPGYIVVALCNWLINNKMDIYIIGIWSLVISYLIQNFYSAIHIFLITDVDINESIKIVIYIITALIVTTARLSQRSLKKSRPAVLRKVSGAKAQNLICA